MKTPTKAEVNRLAQRYHDAMREWGDANLETSRRWQAWQDAKAANEEARKKRAERKLKRAMDDEVLG